MPIESDDLSTADRLSLMRNHAEAINHQLILLWKSPRAFSISVVEDAAEDLNRLLAKFAKLDREHRELMAQAAVRASEPDGL